MTTGSYPLMDLARQFDVDYGDVLIWAHYLRSTRVGPRCTPARYDVFAEAITRIDDALDGGAYEGLLEAMLAHADARWGKGLPLPPLSFLVSA